MQRTLSLTQGDLAAVKFTCPVCDLVIVGMVSVEGNDEKTTSRPAPAEAPKKFVRPLAKFTDPLSEQPAPVEFKTDEEALQNAFGDQINPSDLEAILQNCYPVSFDIGDKKFLRKITPSNRNMGDRGVIKGFLVEFYLGDATVYSRLYSEAEGTPDIEKDMKDLEENAKASLGRTVMAAAPARVQRPTGPVEVISGGWGQGARGAISEPTGDSGDDRIRTAIMRSFSHA